MPLYTNKMPPKPKAKNTPAAKGKANAKKADAGPGGRPTTRFANQAGTNLHDAKTATSKAKQGLI